MLVAFVLVALFLVADLGSSGPISLTPYRNGMSSTQSLSRRDSPKYVVAHYMVGNTYPYHQEDWLSDIRLAHENGIDAFALNTGRDSWQPQQVADAFAAAQQSGTGFKLFMSFDMTSLACDSADDAVVLRNYITTYAQHPNQLIYNDRVVASTFSGESCRFGQASVQLGWKTQFLQQLSGKNAVFFIPSFFVDKSTFQSFSEVLDGVFNWNSAWPLDITASSVQNLESSESVLDSLAAQVGTTVPDEEYLDILRPLNMGYMGSVSPWFFTHYGQDTYNKNWLYVSDHHLYARRWESLIRLRDQVDFVQALSWNDFGESHYIGPIQGAQPNSQTWVDGYDHTGWLNMTSYYAAAYKTGTYPTISKDQVFVWSRPHPALASAPDPVGRPANYQLTVDRFWVMVFATSPGTVTLSTSTSDSQTFDVVAGANKLSFPIHAGGYMRAVLQRSGVTVIDLKPEGFSFDASPSSYNYNAFVAYSS